MKNIRIIYLACVLLPVFFGLNGVFAAIPAAELIVMMIALHCNKGALD